MFFVRDFESTFSRIRLQLVSGNPIAPFKVNWLNINCFYFQTNWLLPEVLRYTPSLLFAISSKSPSQTDFQGTIPRIYSVLGQIAIKQKLGNKTAPTEEGIPICLIASTLLVI